MPLGPNTLLLELRGAGARAAMRSAPFYYIITATLKTRCHECVRDHETG
jgi:hypothetical protein